MKVFKFGGASVNSAERIRNVKTILQANAHEKILVIISAIGKTTNALEDVVHAFFNNNPQQALRLFQVIRQTHLQLAAELSGRNADQLTDLFTEVEWLLYDKPVREYDYYYDQIVCIGELLSTCIISNYLNASGFHNKWMDVRDVIRTDNSFRDARIDWNYTNVRVQNAVAPLFQDYNIVVTQGFIGATDENESTTLGREGSDYSAAVFANLLSAKSQTIWKDVQGVMNADPKLYAKAEWIKELNYQEVIEMAYYGAQVIHPKTIKPLQNKNIPLYVKSFIEPEKEGTVIHHKSPGHLPPIIVYKENQVLIELRSKDFSFVSEELNEVNELFAQLKLKPNLTQIAAISLLYVVDDKSAKVEQLALKAAEKFDVQITKGLTLLTIRHYSNEILHELAVGKPLLKQETPHTVQVLMKQ